MENEPKQSKLKDAQGWAVLALIAFVIIGGFALLFIGSRSIINVTTPFQVVEAEPGVHCAKLVNEKGVAMSCWKIGDCK